MKVLILLLLLVPTFLNTSPVFPLSAENLRVERGTLHYRILGKGTPILLVGGIPGASNDYLLPVAQELGKTQQSIVADLRGTGKSAVTVLDTSTVNLDRILADLEALRSALKLKSWVVLGHSFGGIVAMSYASRFPDRVRALVLIGSGGIDQNYLEYYHPNIVARLTKEDSLEVERAESMRCNDIELSNLEVFRIKLAGHVVGRNHLEEIRRWFNKETYSSQSAQVMWTSLMLSPYNLKGPLRKYKRPVLLIQGEEDPVDKRTAMQTHKAIKQSKLVFIKNCGHFPWLEQKEQFHSSVDKFLKPLR